MRKYFSSYFPIFCSCFFFLVIIIQQRTEIQNIHQKKLNIGIIVVLTNDTDPKDYEVAISITYFTSFHFFNTIIILESVECYARIQNYQFLLVVDSNYDCPQKDKFFRRHCVVSLLLPKFDAVLFIDADHGVVNPKRRIEEFINPQFDLIFYDRFFDWEVMAGSYIARNTPFAIKFLADFSKFENNLPKGAHGSDNGAIHIFLADKIFPGSIEVDVCREVYYKSVNTYDVGAYVACIRGVFGSRTDFGNIRIMEKGKGWSRDDWLTSGLWSPDRDFMLHGWKTKQMKNPPNEVISSVPMNYAQWYNPLAGPIVIGRCFPGNTSWSYNPRLLGDSREIEKSLLKYAKEVERNRAKSLGRMKNLLEDN